MLIGNENENNIVVVKFIEDPYTMPKGKLKYGERQICIFYCGDTATTLSRSFIETS